MRRNFTALALTVALLAPTALSAAAGEDYARVSAALKKKGVAPGGRVLVHVEMSPVQGVKLYRHMTIVELVGPQDLKLEPVELPEGEKKFDEGLEREIQVYKNTVGFDVALRVASDRAPGKLGFTLRLRYQGCTDTFCHRPEQRDFKLELDVSGPAADPTPPPTAPAQPETAPPSRTPGGEAPGGEAPGGEEAGGGDWIRRAMAGGGLLAILASFFAGLLVAFTPCVYPMIPVTVALIGGAASGKDGVKRKSTLLGYTLVYVLGIALTYAVLGALVASAHTGVQRVMQTWWLLGIVGLVMGLLALSMFGAFDLRLPSALSNRLGRFQGAGSLPMLLVSGAVLGLVASPCVSAPVAFLLTLIGSSGNLLFGAASMFAFAWGMSLLLILAGLFPGLLGRPGPWMVWVKTGFGVIMTLAGLYFARTVLPLAAFSLAAVLTVLLAGIALLAGSRRAPETGRGRGWLASLGWLALVVSFYLGFGTAVRSGALVWISHKTLPPAVAAELCPAAEASGAHVTWQPYSPEALQAALAGERPVVIDFYADWCTNCETIDREVFSRPEVAAEMERFVRLRVDGSTGMPKGPVRAAEERLRVAGYPTIVLFTSDGKETARIVGTTTAGSFLAKLRKVR